MKIKITGVKKLESGLKRYRKLLEESYQEGVDDACFYFIDANDDNVPIETGALRNSGRAYQTGKGFASVTVLGYGWEIEEIYMDEYGRIKIPRLYAEIQNDKWAFLENGIDLYQELMLEIIVDRMEQI